MKNSMVFDVLLRKKPATVERTDYQVITVQSSDASRLATNATVAVAIINLRESNAFWEIVGYGRAGAYDEWLKVRQPNEEYWGNYGG